MATTSEKGTPAMHDVTTIEQFLDKLIDGPVTEMCDAERAIRGAVLDAESCGLIEPGSLAAELELIEAANDRIIEAMRHKLTT